MYDTVSCGVVSVLDIESTLQLVNCDVILKLYAHGMRPVRFLSACV